MAPLKTLRAAWYAALALWTLAPQPAALAAAATEQQVKAVFVFNFSHFVQWPADVFATRTQPFMICVLGNEPLAALLDETVKGERVDQHPLQVRRVRAGDAPGACQILYIDRTAAPDLERLMAAPDPLRTLTVSDLDGAASRGVMIELATRNNRVGLTINVDAARAAGLTISSNLLRPAQIVRNGTGVAP